MLITRGINVRNIIFIRDSICTNDYWDYKANICITILLHYYSAQNSSSSLLLPMCFAITIPNQCLVIQITVNRRARSSVDLLNLLIRNIIFLYQVCVCARVYMMCVSLIYKSCHWKPVILKNTQLSLHVYVFASAYFLWLNTKYIKIT